jgi:O-antigen/teichoic acid export membrane protein
MFNELKRLGKQSIVYGFGDALGRLGAFLLLPVYTNYLSLEEYGTLEIFYVTSAVLALFLGRQLSHATLRFYFEYDSKQEQNLVISTCFILYLLFAGLILGICALFSEQFSWGVFSSIYFRTHFVILFLSMFFNLSKEILLAYVRAIEFAGFFVGVSIGDLILKLVLCIYFVVFKGWGVLGVLFGNLAGTFLAWLVLSVFTFKRCGFGVDMSKFKDIFKYALPLIFVGLSGTIIGNAGRFFLKMYVSLGAVGLYALGMRFSSILRFLVVQPFTKAYGPFRFSIMKQENAREIYARVTTYFSFFCAWACLCIAAFSGEVIQIMAKESYWAASSVIPILLISVFFGSGLYYMFQIGVYLEKNTKVLAIGFAIAAIIDIICMIFLVPRFGPLGAAFSQALTHVFIAFMGLYFSNRVYFIPYEWNRLMKIVGLCAILVSVSHFTYHSNPYWSALLKAPIMFLYPTVLLIIGILNKGERSKVRYFWAKFRGNMLGVEP